MKRPITKEEALMKMEALCARSEQCEFDIATKLRAKGLPSADIAEILDKLRQHKFIDSARFARSFTNDKVRFSGWGVHKICAALMAKRIPESDIREALQNIDPEEYGEALARVARAKASSLQLSLPEDRAKLYRYMLSRGFESELAMKELKKLMKQ